tara:strand:+ start:802 stop:1041 length:240 start_codon:yes stop_codon:yes gene_type:complete
MLLHLMILTTIWIVIGVFFGAGNEIRTRDPDLGKVVLYQLSYSRMQKKALRFEVVRIVQKYFYLATINWIFLYKRTFPA